MPILATQNSVNYQSFPFVDSITKKLALKPKKIFARDYKKQGRFPIIDQGQKFISGWTNNEESVIKSGLPMIVFGDHTRVFKYIDFPFALGADGTQLIKPSDEFNPRFFYYACIQLSLPNRGYNRHFTILKEQAIPKPTKSEQQKIAAVLWKVQQAVEIEERLVITSREFKKSAMQQLFTKGLRGEQQKETAIGLLPKSWEILTINELVDNDVLEKPLDGNHGNIHPKSADYVTKGIPFVMACDLKGGVVDFDNCKYITKSQADSLQKGFSVNGDVLISHKGTIGRTAIVSDVDDYIMLTPQVTYYRVKNPNKLLNSYLKGFFDSEIFQNPMKQIAGDGSTRAYIGITRQRELSIVLPSLDEQREIAKIIRGIDQKISLHERKKSILQELFQSLLNKLMTGEIRINDLDIDVSEVTNHFPDASKMVDSISTLK